MLIIVAHPGTQVSRHFALAVQKAGWLEAYVTHYILMKYYDLSVL